MDQLSQDYATQDLLAFYDRVKPVLSKWLAKPVWTARETAMLCAGYVPQIRPEYEKFVIGYQQDSIQDATPIDSHGYMPPDQKLHREYLELLKGKEAASPLHMVQLLRPTSKKADLKDVGGGNMKLVEGPRAFSLKALRDLQWFFIIGNAVGLPVPTLVPFALLDKLSDRLTVQPVRDSETRQAQDQPEATSAWIEVEKSNEPVIAGLTSEVKLNAAQRKIRERQPLQTTPEKRGYHTTEEVAALTNLLSATLNKYAREGMLVEGFTPFKRQNGRFWQWRDDQQQAECEFNNSAGKVKHRPK